MITSKLPFSKWEQVFKDPMTSAVIDCLVHHSTTRGQERQDPEGGCRRSVTRSGPRQERPAAIRAFRFPGCVASAAGLRTMLRPRYSAPMSERRGHSSRRARPLQADARTGNPYPYRQYRVHRRTTRPSRLTNRPEDTVPPASRAQRIPTIADREDYLSLNTEVCAPSIMAGRRRRSAREIHRQEEPKRFLTKIRSRMPTTPSRLTSSSRNWPDAAAPRCCRTVIRSSRLTTQSPLESPASW